MIFKAFWFRMFFRRTYSKKLFLFNHMENFHLKNIKRRMFVIKNGILHLAPTHLNCSHKDWFRKKRWLIDDDDSCMHQLVRGYVDSEGVYFYQGYDAHSPELEISFLKNILNELQNKLKLDDKIHVFFGTIQVIPKKSGKLPPEKDLGTISEIIKTTKI